MTTTDFDAFRRELWDQGARYDGSHPIPVTLTPHYFAAEHYERFTQDAQRVQEAIEVVAHLYCEDADIRARFPELLDLQDYIRRTPVPQRKIGLARFDYIKCDDGSLRLVESNTDCPGGMAIAGIVHRAFRNSAFRDPQTQELLQVSEDPLSFVRLMQTLSGRSHPRVGFVWSRVSPIMNDIQALHDTAAAIEGWPAPWIGPAQELEIADDGTLLADGTPLDVAFTKIDTTTAADGRIHWCAWQDHIDEARPLLEALASGKLRTVSGLPSMMVSESKRAIALLFEPDVRASFTAAQRDAVDRTVARTSRLEAAPALRLWTPEQVFQQKDRFVLKTLIDTRGRGVHIGREHGVDEWARLVKLAATGRMVVQEYLAPRMEWLEVEPGRRERMSTVVALYLYGGQPTGIFGRSSASAVVNVGNGGVIRPALIVRQIPRYVEA